MKEQIILPSTASEAIILNEYLNWEKMLTNFEIIPESETEVLPGIKWGYCDQFFTPSYWKMQYMLHYSDNNISISYRLGENILEEVVACLLGGYGLRSEVGLAAYNRLKNREQINIGIDFQSILKSLLEPFDINRNKIRYRFPNQKAKYIYQFLNRPDLQDIPLYNDLSLRNWLCSIKGIGPKTASWVTRNYLDSDNVAIIDIHIYRAGLLIGLFSDKLDIKKDYFKLEQKYIQFCNALDVQPSKMDAIMWLQMKELSTIALKVINNYKINY